MVLPNHLQPNSWPFMFSWAGQSQKMTPKVTIQMYFSRGRGHQVSQARNSFQCFEDWDLQGGSLTRNICESGMKSLKLSCWLAYLNQGELRALPQELGPLNCTKPFAFHPFLLTDLSWGAQKERRRRCAENRSSKTQKRTANMFSVNSKVFRCFNSNLKGQRKNRTLQNHPFWTTVPCTTPSPRTTPSGLLWCVLTKCSGSRHFLRKALY